MDVGHDDDNMPDLSPISVDQLTHGMASVVSALPMDMATCTSTYSHSIPQVNTPPPPDYNQPLLDAVGNYGDNMHQDATLTSSNSYSLQTQVAESTSYSHTLPQPAHPCPYPPSLPPAYMFPPFDYTSRPLLPPLPPDGSGHTAEPTFLGYQPPDARTFPPPFPGPFPYGLPPFPTDKSLPPLPTYPPPEGERELQEDTPTCTSIGTMPPILPPLQAMPPFPLLPPPGQYFPGGYPPPPPAHSQSVILPPHDLPPCEELVKRHLDDIPTVPNTDSNPASPAPSAMLSPNTSRLLQSAIESDTESIMALSPGTEPVPSPIKVDSASEFRSTEIVAQEEQAFSQYEVEIQTMRRVSPSDTSSSQTGEEHKVPVYRYEDKNMDHLQLPCCQFEAKSSAVQTDEVESDRESEEVSEDEESETDDSEEEEEEDEDDEMSDNDEEVSEPGEQDSETEHTVISCGNRLTSDVVDFSEEIQRVESPFNRIRPSLLKSYRASKRYKDKKKMKKSKILDILSPLSPYDTQMARKKKQMKGKSSEEKPLASEMESELASSSEDISEADGLPKTPFSVLSEQPETPACSTRESSTRVSPVPAEDKASMVSTPQGSRERDFSPGLSPSSSEVPTPQPFTEGMHPQTPRGNDVEFTGFTGTVSEGVESYSVSEHSAGVHEAETMEVNSKTCPYSTYSTTVVNAGNFKLIEEKDRHSSVEEKLHVFGMYHKELSTQRSEGFEYDLSSTETTKSVDDKNYSNFYSKKTMASSLEDTCDQESYEGGMVGTIDDNVEDKEGLHLVQEIQLYEKHLQNVVNGGEGLTTQGQKEEVEDHLTESIVKLNDQGIINIRPITATSNHGDIGTQKVWSDIKETTSAGMAQQTVPISTTETILEKSSQKTFGYYSCESDDIPSESESSVYEHSDSGDTGLSEETFKKPSIDCYLRAVGRFKTESPKPGLNPCNVSGNGATYRTEPKTNTVPTISLPNFGSSFGRPSQLTCLYTTNFLRPEQNTTDCISLENSNTNYTMSDSTQSKTCVSYSKLSHIPNIDIRSYAQSVGVTSSGNVAGSQSVETSLSTGKDLFHAPATTGNEPVRCEELSSNLVLVNKSISTESNFVMPSTQSSEVVMSSLSQTKVPPTVVCGNMSLVKTSTIVQAVDSADYSGHIPSVKSHVSSSGTEFSKSTKSPAIDSCTSNLMNETSLLEQSVPVSSASEVASPTDCTLVSKDILAPISISQSAAASFSSSVTKYTTPVERDKQVLVPLPKITSGLCAILVQPVDMLGNQPQQKPMVITAMKKGEKLVVQEMASNSSVTKPLLQVANRLTDRKKSANKGQKTASKSQELSKIHKQKQILPKPAQEELTDVPEVKSSSEKNLIITKKTTNVCLEEPLLDGPPISQGFYCVECNKMYPAGCSLHEQQYTCIQDNNPTKARTSVPAELCLRAMYNQTSPDFMGVICRSLIPAKTKFGPLQGIRMTKHELENPQNTAYVWEIFDEENPNLVLDCRDENHSNWLMFVKRARSSREQNLMVYQESLQIYFITIRDIGSGEELLYWYGRDYAVMLGLCIKPEELFKCQKCHRQFPDKDSLQTHMKAAHPKLDMYTNSCEHCGKVFRIPSLLKKHVRSTHERIKTYVCEVCTKGFSDLNNFRRHKKLHTDSSRQFECNECGRKFTQKHHLTDHMTIHTGERNYPCRFCDKRFSRRQDVRSHEKTVHIVDTEFKCAKCDQIFYSKKYYNSHMKTHEPRQFHCHMCEKQFTQKVHLKAHLVAKHRTGIDCWEKAVNYKPKNGSRVT